MNPNIHDTGVALIGSHCISYSAATLCVLNPKVANGLVGVGKRKTSALGVRETRGIEVKLHVSFFCPFHPTLEMFYLHLVAVHKLSAELSVSFMEIQTHVSCEKTRNLVNVLTQLVDVACFAGIITCGLNTARSSFVALKTHNVISLPAMQ